MKILRLMLTAVFVIFTGMGIFAIVTGTSTSLATVMVALYVAAAFALNGRGSRPVRFAGLLTGGLLSFLLVGALFAAVQPALGYPFEPVLLVSALCLGLLGVATIMAIRSQSIVTPPTNPAPSPQKSPTPPDDSAETP